MGSLNTAHRVEVSRAPLAEKEVTSFENPLPIAMRDSLQSNAPSTMVDRSPSQEYTPSNVSPRAKIFKGVLRQGVPPS